MSTPDITVSGGYRAALERDDWRRLFDCLNPDEAGCDGTLCWDGTDWRCDICGWVLDLVPCDICDRLVPRAELEWRALGEADYGICRACRRLVREGVRVARRFVPPVDMRVRSVDAADKDACAWVRARNEEASGAERHS